jgi:TP901 family phage tail tape measure protein
MEKRRIDIKVTSNAKKVMNDLGTGAEKAGKKSTGVLSKIKGLAGSIGAGFTAATAGVRAFTVALVSSGVGAIVVAMGSLVALMGKAINTSREFEAALSTLKAITGATNEEIAALSQNARELGATTAFTASQVVELQTEFSKLGFTTGEILKATEATLDLAAASETDLASAAAVAGSTLRGFGLDAGETQRVVDVMAKSFTSSALDMEKFRESMKLVAPIAKTVKVPIEEASAALAILADRGVSGSMAGTQLRRIMSDLAQKTGKDFQTSLEITADRLGKATSTAEKLAIAKELVGDRAKGSLIALAENREALNGLKIAFDAAGGAAEVMAEEKLNNLNGDLTKLRSAWEGFLLGIENGEGVLNKISRGAVQLLTNSLTFLTKASTAVADGFAVNFASAKRVASTAASRLGETFTNLGLMIQKFATEAKISLADVPIIGKLIDKEAAQESLVNIESELEASNARLAELADKAGNESVFRAEHYARLRAEREVKVAEEAAKKIEKIEESFEESEVGEEKIDEKAKRIAEQRIKILKKVRDMEEAFEAKTEEEKLELELTNHLRELEALEINETEKHNLKLRLEELYSQKREELRDQLAERTRIKEEQEAEEKAEREKRLHDRKIQMQLEFFDNAARLAGEETKLGKTLLAFKALIAANELRLEIKSTLAKAKESSKRVAMISAEGGAEIAKGSAKAGATLNPFLIASWAVTAIGLAATLAKAVKKSKSLTGGFSGGDSGAPVATAPTQISQENTAPSFNVISGGDTGQQRIAEAIERVNKKPLKAYVVSSDISNQQSLDRRSEESASL